MNLFFFPEIKKLEANKAINIYRVSQKKLPSKQSVWFVYVNFFVNSILKKIKKTATRHK